MDAPRRSTVNLSQKTGAATTKPSLKPRPGAANVKPGVAKPAPAGNDAKPTGAPKPSPSATTPMGPAQLGKAAACSDLLDTRLDIMFQMLSIKRRSRASKALKKPCQQRVQLFRR